jgi:hypothetical protein
VKCEVVTRSQARTGQANYIPVTGCEANVTGKNVTGKAFLLAKLWALQHQTMGIQHLKILK